MSKFKDTLFEYQRKSAQRADELLFAKKGPTDSVFILDEVGLGKTKEALAILRLAKLRQKKKFKAIVLTPSHKLVRQWQKECDSFTGDSGAFNYRSKSIPEQRLLASRKITLIHAVAGAKKRLNIAFASGSELKNFGVLNRLEREYVLSSFSAARGRKFLLRLGVPRKWIPEYLAARNEYRDISRKDKALAGAVKKLGPGWSQKDFKKAWLLEIGRKHKFSMIVVDEFHNYTSFIAKKPRSGENVEPDFESLVWDEFFKLNRTDKNIAVKKVFLSATPFRPIRLNVLAENEEDPISFILDGLSNTFQYEDQERLRRAVVDYNQKVLELRKKLAGLTNTVEKWITRDSSKSIFAEKELVFVKKQILRRKKEIETILNRYLLRNQRLQKKNSRQTIPRVIRRANIFDKYLLVNEALGRGGKNARNDESLLMFFTSGNFFDRTYGREHYKVLERLKKNKFLRSSELVDFLGDHPKLRELKTIFETKLKWGSRRNPPIWLDPKNVDEGMKALVFCGYIGTANFLEKELQDEYQHPDKRGYDSSDALKPVCEEMFKAIVGKENYENNLSKSNEEGIKNFYLHLPTYIKRWGMRARKKVTRAALVAYVKKTKLEDVLSDYYSRVCDGDFNKFFDNLGAIAQWSFMRIRHGPVARYAESTGGTGEKTGSERLEDLRTAFNSPFYPYAVVATNAGSEGVNLHSYCKNVVHYEQDWMPATIEQRTGRVDRINSLAARLRADQVKKHFEELKTSPHVDHLLEPAKPTVEVCNCFMCKSAKSIDVYRLIVEGTIDEYMYNRERERALWVDLFIGGEDVSKMLDNSVGLNRPDLLENEIFQENLDVLISEIAIQLGKKKVIGPSDLC